MKKLYHYLLLTLAVFFASDHNIFAQVYEGVATHFEALGTPYGGCGVPEDLLETPDYVALNVFYTPGVYDSFTRPIKGSDTTFMGEFNNGYNCGRWVKVTIGPDCNGANDGAQNQPFCRDGEGWFDDEYSGATLYMIVADACGDGNAWCRDSPYHLDLSTQALNKFEKDGQAVGDMYPLHFNNRKITWEYIEAPGYSGDIKIYFMEGAQYYWPAIVITHLRNGISKVEQRVGDNWIEVDRNSDMGQAFILKDLSSPYTIRVYDIDGNLINDGREYILEFPASCGNECQKPATEVLYETVDPVLTGFEKENIKNYSVKAIGGRLEMRFEDSKRRNIVVTNTIGRKVFEKSTDDKSLSIPVNNRNEILMVGIMNGQSIVWEKVFIQ